MESFDSFLELILNSIESKVDLFEQIPSYENLLLLKNYILFFMIITLNLKENPIFIKTVFNGETNFFHGLIAMLERLKFKTKFYEIINNLFLDEYKEVFFNKNKPDKELEQIYVGEKTSFREKYQDLPFYLKKEEYNKLFSKLLKFEISYKDFFVNDNDKIELEEKAAYKLAIVQSLIRVIFSKEKKVYSNEKFYEFNILKKVIDKDIEETYEKFGDQYKTLFRKEDICDDFLKYIFFIFGNEMMIKSFVNPVRKELRKIGFNDRDINKEEFDTFVTTFIANLKETIPSVLTILLKLLYESVKSHFTIEEDNYGPLYTTLIFNYIINPRVQAIFNINSQKNAFVRSLNRILRNTCFNFKFSDSDPLGIFNDIIEQNHLKIKDFIKNQIIEINLEDNEIKSSLENIFTEDYMIYPNFLFYLDSNILFESEKNGVNEFTEYEKNRFKSNDDWIVV